MTQPISATQAFKEGDCLAFQLSSGEYGGIVVCRVETYREVNKYFLLVLDLASQQAPSLQDFLKAHTYGRAEPYYLDDVLIILDRHLPAFFGKFQVIANVDLAADKIKIGAFRLQDSFQEFEESVQRIQQINYQERNPVLIKELTPN